MRRVAEMRFSKTWPRPRKINKPTLRKCATGWRRAAERNAALDKGKDKGKGKKGDKGKGRRS